MAYSFVVRLADSDDRLLAWARVSATAKPQRPNGGSCPLFAAAPTVFTVTRAGIASQILVHWPDFDIVRRAPLMNPTEVAVGQVFTFSWVEPVWLLHGERGIELEGVTEPSSVTIGVPPGGIGLVSM